LVSPLIFLIFFGLSRFAATLFLISVHNRGLLGKYGCTVPPYSELSCVFNGANRDTAPPRRALRRRGRAGVAQICGWEGNGEAGVIIKSDHNELVTGFRVREEHKDDTFLAGLTVPDAIAGAELVH
jgi:hypothetical protein